MANREAIDEVKNAETRVEQLRKDAENEKKEIESKKDEKIDEMYAQLEQELSDYRAKNESEINNKLNTIKSESNQMVVEKTKQFEKAYEAKKSELSNWISLEVLNRYGNS